MRTAVPAGQAVYVGNIQAGATVINTGASTVYLGDNGSVNPNSGTVLLPSAALQWGVTGRLYAWSDNGSSVDISRVGGVPYVPPFALADGTLLVQAVHSNDYVPGVSGWSIGQDGVAQFDDVSILAGKITGASYVGNNSAGTVVQSSTWTDVTGWTAQAAGFGGVSQASGVLTIANAGLYVFIGSACLTPASGPNIFGTQFLVQSSSAAYGNNEIATTAGKPNSSLSVAVIAVGAGERVHFQAYQTTGAAQNLTNIVSLQQLACFRLG